ncbi:peroxidase family protein [Phaeovulum sp. W22_SRMD_FR3]|uniref:peroxidase family protein n=1 Tax=Phaeovulum sp. W22_SRMD_FR3 TaxID=3240274 RepID=UPI003F9A1587
MIKLGASDLTYLLSQVKIGTDYSQLNGPLDPNGVREVAGSNNNLVGAFDENGVFQPGANINGDWGQADTDFLRMFATDHPSGPAAGVIYTYGSVSKMAVTDANGVAPGGAGYIPTFGDAPFDNIVMDGSPRLVSQLIASSDVDPLSPTYNPAAYEAMMAMGGNPVDTSNSVVGTQQTAFIPNPGILGGVPYNEWFVAFGQFFDHGLDFISKGGGYVMIEIKENDPLYVSPTLPGGAPNPAFIPGASNMMMLSRASLSNPASDFDATGHLLPDVVPLFNNNTGLLIDQSQTYGSAASVNALLREYDAAGHLTGRLIDASADGMVGGVAVGAIGADGRVVDGRSELATWADMKANALHIGIELTDMDVLDAPLMRVNSTGGLMFTPQSTVMYRSDLSVSAMGAAYNIANDPFYRDAAGNVLHTHQAILADIAQGANPGDPHVPFVPELLAQHYVSGDGRVNENVGLTAVHHVFHEEHNMQVAAIQAAVLEQAALLTGAAANAYLAEWQTAPGVWNGERLYQAARIITESEYNHIAIDQYVGGLYPALPEFVSYSADINMSVTLEFSQAVFRLGHSQLSEMMQFAVVDANGVMPGEAGYVPTYSEVGLFDAFLNPALYEANSAAGITLGLLNQQGNEIDEFVTSGVQQSLLGAPLDLAALNIARGRDVGLPTLNELRKEVYDGLNQINPGENGSGIAPYTSWADYGGHLRNPASLVNFIAAYARDDDPAHDWGIKAARDAYLAGTGTLADIRAAAAAVITAANDALSADHFAAINFLQGAPVYDPVTRTWSDSGGGDQGFWDVDLWIGGLAEQQMFDGPLGTTFSFVMLDFAQRMQDGDRFYYLYRMPVGQHLGDQIIGEQFSDLIMRTTGLEHIADAFAAQTAYYTLDGTGSLSDVDADDNINDYFNAIYELQPDGSSANGGHIVVAGLDGDDYIIAGLGDDVVYGDAGNDRIEGAQGNDHLYGGDGDDYISDYENDDFISGGNGNDTIFAGPGVLDTSHGNDGDDEVHGGDGVDEVFGDDGDDRLYGEGDTDLIMGGDGNDFMDGGDSVDEMFGGNGNDWMRGGVGDDNINGGSGNDLMEGGLGPTANDGDRLNGDSPLTPGQTILEYNGDGSEGDMDIVSYENVGFSIVASLQDANANGTSSNLRDTYAFDEGLVGSGNNDTLTGADDSGTAGNGANNYLIGGGGDDILTGLGGDDLIVGDSAVVDNSLYWIGDQRSMTLVPAAVSVAPRINEFHYDDSGNDSNQFIEVRIGAGQALNGLTVTLYNGANGQVYATLPVTGSPASSDANYDYYVVSLGNSNGFNDPFQNGNPDGISLSNAGGLIEFLSYEGSFAATNGVANGVTSTDVGVSENGFGSANDSLQRADGGSWASDAANTRGAANTGSGQPTYTPKVIDHIITNWMGTGEDRPVFTDGSIGHILGDHGAEGRDIAVFRGRIADYTITFNPDGTVTVHDDRDPATTIDPVTGVDTFDGTDTLIGIETARFSNGTVKIVNQGPSLALHAYDLLGTYIETFGTASYSGTDAGSPSPAFDWTTSWVESNDNGSPNSGDIRISGGRLNFTGTNAGNESISRAINLAGVQSATLSFDYQDVNVTGSEAMNVEAWNGTGWDSLGSINTSGSGSFSAVLSGAQLGAGSQIRFRASGNWDNGDDVFIDNIHIAVTGPAAAPSVNYTAATYVEGGAEVAIANMPGITDPDDTSVHSARIVLLNARAGDMLNEHGIGGDGISGAVTTEGANLVLTLTGTASFAEYQAAIQAVTFSSSSADPDETDRVIQVTVNDGYVDSNVALATVAVQAVDNIVAGADRIITNFTGTIQVPAWALLANDSSPNSPLSLTSATETPAGQFSFSVSGTNPVNLSYTTTSDRTFTYTAHDGVLPDATGNVQVHFDSNSINGTGADEIMFGDNDSDTFTGGGGNDIIFAGGGNDNTVWFVGDGRDTVNGGTGTGDTFTTNGGGTYKIYAIAGASNAAQRSALATMLATTFLTDTEIVITHTPSGGMEGVIAEIDNVEELVINGLNVTANNGGGLDTNLNVSVFGDFAPTALAYSTIHVNGGDGDDSVDISGMTSDHRIVFHSGLGDDHFYGGMRPQDVMDDQDGTAPDDGGATDPTPETPTELPANWPYTGTDAGETMVWDDAPDHIFGLGGNDNIFGRGGNDRLFGDEGNDRLFGEAGDDYLDGGAGNDVIFGGDGNDRFIAHSGDGDDVYYGDDDDAYIDTLDMSAIDFRVTVDLGNGYMERGSVYSSATGRDTIWGVENAITGRGNDAITASDAVNVMDGGAGHDTYRFLSAQGADGDTIVGFEPGDRIDLSRIDADGDTAGDQAFTLVSGGFSGALGELMVSYATDAEGEVTVIEGNASGDDTAEFSLTLRGHHALTGGDFNL